MKKKFNKALVFVGPAESGKTRMARLIAEEYEEDEVLWIKGRGLNINSPFILQNCTPKTKLLIIDDVTYRASINWFLPAITSGIIVNQKNKKPWGHEFEQIIITADESVDKETFLTPSSIARRFTVVESPFLFAPDEYDK